MESRILTISICGQMKIHMRFSINISAGICGDNLFGPHILPNRLTGWNYKAFLENNIPNFLADVPLIIHRELHFMHYGAPTHLSLVACRYLN
jgi:hypothetical protein